MKRARAIFILATLLAPASFAQIVTGTPHGIVVAHDGRVALAGRWNVAGVKHATAVAHDDGRVAVLDALNNELVLVDLASGAVTRTRTEETPIDAVFTRRDLYVLARDGESVQVFPPRGAPLTLRVQADAIRASGDRVYVYSRTRGAISEIAGHRLTRELRIAPFASDFEIAGGTAYLVYPRDARVRTADLATMKQSGEIVVGAVPVDLAFAGGGSALTARILAVADPSAKRVWLTESTQSTASAVARGFLRGFLGLGLFGSRSSQFPTGVDRVVIDGTTWLAYDTSTRTLYRFTKKTSRVVASGIEPTAFAITPNGIAIWHNGRLEMR